MKTLEYEAYDEAFDLGAPGWNQELSEFLNSFSILKLAEQIERRYQVEEVNPARENLFHAFKACDFDDVKVVILGQDPYPDGRNANGMAFAINPGVPIPASLFNIKKELSDSGHGILTDTTLYGWAKQGVFLLNTVLTTRNGFAGGHRNVGWQGFTGEVIQRLLQRDKATVWLLLGNDAKKQLANRPLPPSHRIVATTHPSPLSARSGFFGSGCFTQVNNHLKDLGTTEITWGV